MKKNSNKALVVSLVVGMLFWLVPIMAYADDEICQIIDTDGITIVDTYDDFGDALADVADGQTIQLLNHITYNSTIVVTGKTITFDVNGYVLKVEILAPATGHALNVGAGGEVKLVNTKPGGRFDVAGRGGSHHGAYAHDGGKIEVTNATTDNTGVNGYGVNAVGNGSEITVYGNITFGGFYGIGASGGSTVTVYGNVNGGGGMTVRDVGTTVTVYGSSSGGGTAVLASNGVEVYVKGNAIGGNFGVSAQSGAKITVDGYIRSTTGSQVYITFGGTNNRDQVDYIPVSSKEHYFEYNDEVSYVWVKYFDPAIFTLDIVTQPGNLTVIEGSITESLLCEAEVSHGGTVYYQWYSNTANSSSGGTLISGATSSTFVLPTTLLVADSPYYYYCVVSADGVASKTSDVATITVIPPPVYEVVVNGSYAVGDDGTGEYLAGATVTIVAGSRTGYSFSGWTVDAGDVTLAQASSATTTFVMPAEEVSVTANWDALLFDVAVNGSSAGADSGAGEYLAGSTVTLQAGSRSGYSFTGWTVDTDNVTLAQANNATTTFVMPAEDVTVTANWEEVPFNVVVSGSYAGADSGAGEYLYGDTVTLKAGSRSGYTFKGWTVDTGNVTLAQASSATTTFVMPAEDVTVTANWVKTTPPGGGTGTPQTGDDQALVLCLEILSLTVLGCGLIAGSTNRRKYQM